MGNKPPLRCDRFLRGLLLLQVQQQSPPAELWKLSRGLLALVGKARGLKERTRSSARSELSFCRGLPPRSRSGQPCVGIISRGSTTGCARRNVASLRKHLQLPKHKPSRSYVLCCAPEC